MRIISTSLSMCLAAVSFIVVRQDRAIAQVTTDGTVGTQVDRDGSVTEITGGETRGSNLFHSFQEFSVPANSEAFFNNSNDIANIFSRVTGGSASNIDGLIRANGSASLFLINPAGIFFGAGARLDLGGSFYGSTADSILFEDSEFSATELDNPLLTINAPIGLGFRDNPGEIVNRANFGLDTRVLDGEFSGQFAAESFTAITSIGLEVEPGQNFFLVGGDVSLENMAGITAPEGRVELGGLSEAGTVSFNDDGSLSYPEDIDKSDVSLTEDSRVEVRGNTGGTVDINAQNLLLSGRSKIYAGIAEGKGTEDSQAGNITINATDSVQIIGSNPSPVGLGTEINNHVGTAPLARENTETPSDAVGNGGEVIVNTKLLEISDQARITANSYSLGNSGNITLNTDNILVNGGAIASLVLEGTGDTGNVTVNNTDSIILNEGSNIQAQVLNNGSGNVGDVTIDTQTLAINERFSFILADNASAGNGGNIIINASESVFVDGGGGEDLGATLSAILSQIQIDVTGDAGDITIATPELTLVNFGLISTTVREGSVGNTGDIFLDVETLTLDNGSSINALTENDFDGGSINVDANTVTLRNGGKIVTSGDRGGNGGSINLNVADSLTIDSADAPLTLPFQEQILIDTASEAGLFSNTLAGTGNGGSIEVQANSVELANNAAIVATTSTGTGGDVTLRIDETIGLQNNSLISAEAGGNGNGGNINIDTGFVIAFPDGNSDIIASASQGQGGNITIDAESLFGIRERPLSDLTNDINASSEFSLDGNITINTPDLNPVQGVTELPQTIIESREITAQACQGGQDVASRSGFLIKGKGGIPATPVNPLESFQISVDSEIKPTAAKPKPLITSRGKIQPARGIMVKENGDISLTAHRTDSSGERLPEIKANCS